MWHAAGLTGIARATWNQTTWRISQSWSATASPVRSFWLSRIARISWAFLGDCMAILTCCCAGRRVQSLTAAISKRGKLQCAPALSCLSGIRCLIVITIRKILHVATWSMRSCASHCPCRKPMAIPAAVQRLHWQAAGTLGQPQTRAGWLICTRSWCAAYACMEVQQDDYNLTNSVAKTAMASAKREVEDLSRTAAAAHASQISGCIPPLPVYEPIQVDHVQSARNSLVCRMELQLKDMEEKVKAAELEAEQKQAALEAALAKHAFLSTCTTCKLLNGLM